MPENTSAETHIRWQWPDTESEDSVASFPQRVRSNFNDLKPVFVCVHIATQYTQWKSRKKSGWNSRPKTKLGQMFKWRTHKLVYSNFKNVIVRHENLCSQRRSYWEAIHSCT